MMKYDVVIRCKNELAELPRVLSSLQNQIHRPRKIIFVDNGSTDGSLEFATKAGCQIVPYGLEKFNYSRALNLGMACVESPAALLLSAHCPLIGESAVERLIEAMDLFGAAGVFGRQIPTRESNPLDIRDLLTVFGRERIVYESYPFFHNAFALIKTDSWKTVQFCETINGIEDRFWAREQCKRGLKIVYEPSAVVYHKHGLNQTQSQDRARRICEVLKILHDDDIVDF